MTKGICTGFALVALAARSPRLATSTRQMHKLALPSCAFSSHPPME
jgi:hypothetical protein